MLTRFTNPFMTIKEIVNAIERKHRADGIVLNPPNASYEIESFERTIGFVLPADFKEFYSICNGLECDEDIFRIMPLEEILEYERYRGKDWFDFAEYMIYSDAWALRRCANGVYELCNTTVTEIVLTSSLREFLQRFLTGGVFGNGGLYDWQKELSGG